MKRSLILLFLTSIIVYSQQLPQMRVVDTPRLLKNEMVGSQHRDANNRIAAAIKVISDMEGFTYQSNNGIVEVERAPGVDIVYLQPDERVLEIYKSGYEPLKVILSEYSIKLESRQVWELKVTGEKKPVPVTILSTPSDAEKILDGKSLGTGETFIIIPGKHELRLRKAGYKELVRTIEVSERQTLFRDLNLQEVVPVMVTIQSIPREADIYINNVNEGKTNKQLFKFPGEYTLRLSKDKYETVEQTITVTESGRNTWSFTLQKTTAILSLSVTPSDAEVYINGTLERERSIELAPGRYRIEVKKDGWYDESRTITIQKGTDQRQTFSLKQMTGTLQFVVEPMETQVTLKSGETTIESWTGSKYIRNIPVGNYTLICNLSGYEPQTKSLMIEENETVSLDVKMVKGVSQATTATGKCGVEMVLVKGGTFQMGSTEGDSDEKPVHSVTVNNFYISKYEVSQALYQEVMGTNPSYFSGDNLPVEEVSWYDAVEFCNALSQKEGLTPVYTISGTSVSWNQNANGYRLPTEAEWEYAAGGGSSNRTKWAGTNSESRLGNYAWYDSNSGNKTHPVGTKQPNSLGLYDMSGNVWEWCWDWHDSDYYSSSPSTNPAGPYSGSSRVLRGGSWGLNAPSCRVANRYNDYPSYRDSNLGFRILRNVP
jgi:formylglycine-generating enzyme required for sulfatase activity